MSWHSVACPVFDDILYRACRCKARDLLEKYQRIHTDLLYFFNCCSCFYTTAFTRPIGTNGGSTVPAIDLYQTDEEVVVKAALPGLGCVCCALHTYFFVSFLS